MTQFERWSLAASIFALGLNSVIFVLFWLQVRLLRQQNAGNTDSVARDHQQRRLAETMQYYTEAFILTSSGDDYTAREWQFVTDRIAGQRPAAPTDLESIRARLRLFEVFASGVNLGAFSVEVADRAAGSTVLAAWLTYRDLIYAQRERMSNPRLYEEFESLAERLIETNATFWRRITADVDDSTSEAAEEAAGR